MAAMVRCDMVWAWRSNVWADYNRAGVAVCYHVLIIRWVPHNSAPSDWAGVLSMPQTSTDYRHTIHINPLPTTIHHSPSCGDMHSDDRDAPQVWKNCMAQLWVEFRRLANWTNPAEKLRNQQPAIKNQKGSKSKVPKIEIIEHKSGETWAFSDNLKGNSKASASWCKWHLQGAGGGDYTLERPWEWAKVCPWKSAWLSPTFWAGWTISFRRQ